MMRPNEESDHDFALVVPLSKMTSYNMGLWFGNTI